MNWDNLIQASIFILVLVLAVKPLGIYMARVYEGAPAGLNVWFGGIERLIYRLCGVKETQGMSWTLPAIQ